MPSGCEDRFREIQGARDELTHQGAWSRDGDRNGGPTPRQRQRPRWSYEMPNARRHPGDDDWGEFWGAEERKRKGYEAEAGHHWLRRHVEHRRPRGVGQLGLQPQHAPPAPVYAQGNLQPRPIGRYALAGHTRRTGHTGHTGHTGQVDRDR